MSYFNTEDIEGGEYALIPQGRYNFVIENCEEKITKTNKIMICLRVKIIEGEQENRVHFENLLTGDDGYVGESSRRKLKALILGCGLTSIDDPSDLNDKFFSAKISHGTNKNGEQTCKIMEFKEYGYVETAKEIPKGNKKEPVINASAKAPTPPAKPATNKLIPPKSPTSKLSQFVNNKQAVTEKKEVKKDDDIPF